MRPLFAFRPEPGWSITAENARATGLDVRGLPLFAVEPLAWEKADPSQFDGVLVGSANVFRHGGPGLRDFANLPVHVVGDATADAARVAGFMVARICTGGLQALLDTLAGRELKLLRLAGEERVPLVLPPGIGMETRVVYRTVPGSLDEETARSLHEGGVVLLHSAVAAAHFVAQCREHEIERGRLDVVVIGPRVAEACGAGWKSIHTAPAPTDSDMLALASPLCQN